MKHVTAREANQRFSELLAEVAVGEEVVITRNGKPVARLAPIAGAARSRRRPAAIRRMVQAMKRGVDLGGLTFERDELYER